MDEGEFKKRTAEKSFMVSNAPGKVVFSGYVDDLVEEAKKEMMDFNCRFVRLPNGKEGLFFDRENAERMKNAFIKWFGEVKKDV